MKPKTRLFTARKVPLRLVTASAAPAVLIPGLFLIPVLLLLAFAGLANAVALGQCLTLATAGQTYALNQSVDSAASCMNVTAENVTLDCAGFTINYSSASTGYGVESNSTNTTVKNCGINKTSYTTTYSYGIYFNGAGSSNGTIYNNTIRSSSDGEPHAHGVYLVTSSNNNVTNNSITFGGLSITCYGIYFDANANNNTVSNNTIASVYGHALMFTSSSNNVITSNNLTASSNSVIYLAAGSNNNSFASENAITGGSTGQYGFYSSSSTNSTLTDNRFNSSNSVAIYITGTTSSDYNQSIDASNLAEGLPINYTYDGRDLVYQNVASGTYGQVICAWCDNVTYNNFNMTADGFSFYNTSNSLINNSVVSTDNGYGLFVSGSSSSFDQNNAFNLLNITTSTASGLYGIYFNGATGNNITNSNVSTNGSSAYGIYFFVGSNDNNVLNTSVTIDSDLYTTPAILVRLANNNNFTNVDLETSGTGSNNYGVEFYDAQGNTVKDSVINAAGVADVYTRGANDYTNNVVNSTFNKSDAGFLAGATDKINVYWYVDARVTGEDGVGISGASVGVSDVNGSSVFSGTTNSTGWIATQTIQEYVQDATGIYNMTPHLFSVSLAGYYANDSQYAVSSGLFGVGALSIVLARPASVGGEGGGLTPTPTPVASPTPTSTPTPTASPVASPLVSLTPVPSVGATVAPTPAGGEPTLTASERNNILSALEVGGSAGSVSSCNSTVCRAGESANVVVRRTIDVIQTPNGVLTRVTLRVSNEGKATAFGVSVSEFVDSLSKGEKVEYSSLPERFFEGGAEWVIDVLPPGVVREFSYGVFRRVAPADIAGLSAPVVFVRSAGVVSGKLDYSLFYAALVVLVAAAVAWAYSRKFKNLKR